MTARFLLHIREWQDGIDGSGVNSTSMISDVQFANDSVETIETFGDHENFEATSSPKAVMKSAQAEVGPSWRYRSHQNEELASTLV